MEKKIAKQMRQLGYEINNYLNKDSGPIRSLNETQLQIVNYLMCHENVIQKDLEAETQLKKSSITGSIDSLVQKGIVTRVKSDPDKRKNYVVLTSTALEDRREFEERLEKLDGVIGKDIDRKDLETFAAVLDKMVKNLKGVD